MNYRTLLLLAGASAAILVPLATHALPMIQMDHSGHARMTLVDDDGQEAEGNRQDLRTDDLANCGGDDDDDEDGGCASGSRTTPMNAAPPGNGFFTPGAKPQVQIN